MHVKGFGEHKSPSPVSGKAAIKKLTYRIPDWGLSV